MPSTVVGDQDWCLSHFGKKGVPTANAKMARKEKKNAAEVPKGLAKRQKQKTTGEPGRGEKKKELKTRTGKLLFTGGSFLGQDPGDAKMRRGVENGADSKGNKTPCYYYGEGGGWERPEKKVGISLPVAKRRKP